jgi:peptidoglycan/xylan/chitin deacetylase (PgdA/CDA1 family)
MIVSKRVAVLGVLALVGGFASYRFGLSGLSLAQAINDSRCSAGAFIAHAQPPANLAEELPATGTAISGAPVPATLQPVSTSGPNLITNPGFESLASGSPVGWSTAKSGQSNAAFTQVVGHNTSRAVRVDISSYQTGMASWSVGWITVQPGTYYQFNDYYRSNVPTHATLLLKNYAGTTQSEALTTTPLSLNWAAYTTRFFVPTDVSQIQIVHGIQQVGALETDNYALTSATPVGFNRAMVSVTFDGGYASVYENALPIMQRDGVVSTQYVDSGFLGVKGYDSPGQLYDFLKAGHEVASHSEDQVNLTGLSPTKLSTELASSYAGLSHCYGAVTDFSNPYGAYNATTTTAASQLYQTARSEDSGYNSKDQFDPYTLKVQIVQADTSAADLKAWLNTASDNHVWLILVYHQVGNEGGQLSRTPQQFEADMRQLTTSGIAVETVHNAYAEAKAQLKH